MNHKQERFHKYLDMYGKLVRKNVDHHIQRTLVEDIMQETFLRFYEHLDFLEEEQVKAWLLIVSGNIARDYRKKGAKYEMLSLDDENIAEDIEEKLSSTAQSVETVLNKKAARELLRTALELLYEKNPIWYYVIVDACMMEMSTKQIAEALNLTTINVDVIKRRARKYLLKELGTQYREIVY